MKVVLIYKGFFDSRAAGPEMRYLALADEFTKIGHEVTIFGRKASPEVEKRFHFVCTSHPLQVLKQATAADIIVLHGGGPFLLFVATLARARGAGIVLDGYAPHWLELYSAGGALDLKRTIKIVFNLGRLTWAAAGGVDRIVVGNQRQQDLVRGFLAVFGRVESMEHVVAISYGCETLNKNGESNDELMENRLKELQKGAFLFGWIGGTWDWFDFAPVFLGLREANRESEQPIVLCFFGTREDEEIRLSGLASDYGVRERIVFFPRVPYMHRLSVWRHLDATLVWGGSTFESEYASRTRNFDSVVLGLPIIQNRDGEWSGLLSAHGGGLVCDAESLGSTMAMLAKDREKYEVMCKQAKEVATHFAWSKIAREWDQVFGKVRNRTSKSSGLIQSLLAISAIILFTPIFAIASARQFR